MVLRGCGTLMLRASVVCAAIAVLAFPGTGRAGMIPLGNSGWTAEFDSGLDPFVNIVVSDETVEAVFIRKLAEFVAPPQNGQIPPINILFRQTRAGAVPFIVINDEVVKNSTGVTWLDFHMELTQDVDARFDVTRTGASGGPPPIGFNVAPFTNAAFANNNTLLNIDGGQGIASGATWTPGAEPNGGQLWIAATVASQSPFTVFALKERPTIPEPGGLALLSLGALALVRRRGCN